MSKFIDFDAKTIAQWRSHPVTAAFIEWVALEGDSANYECASLLRKGDDRKAMSVAGKAECFEEILRTCHRADPPAQEVDEPVMDPSFRFNPEMAPTFTTEEADDAGTI